MTKYHAGVEPVQVFITVNEVIPASRTDHKRLDRLVRLTERSAQVCVRSVQRKDNRGRDFGPLYHNLRQIIPQAHPEDYILCVNRSSYGPLMAGWYGRFVEQYEKFPDTGLCGNTINFAGWDDHPIAGVTTHVQTYAFLTQIQRFIPFMDHFPGVDAESRGEAIVYGELALSRRILEMNLGLTCLAWPAHRFTLQHPVDPHLPQNNIARFVRGVPFRKPRTRDKIRTRLMGPYYRWKANRYAHRRSKP
jgi:hypothetical protein